MEKWKQNIPNWKKMTPFSESERQVYMSVTTCFPQESTEHSGNPRTFPHDFCNQMLFLSLPQATCEVFSASYVRLLFDNVKYTSPGTI